MGGATLPFDAAAPSKRVKIDGSGGRALIDRTSAALKLMKATFPDEHYTRTFDPIRLARRGASDHYYGSTAKCINVLV